MANYYATTRSNYFHVNDAAAFKAWASSRNLEVWMEDDRFAVSADTGDCNGWPAYDGEAEQEIDFEQELSDHLVEGEVAILLEIGSEKQRYLIGRGVAVNAAGDVTFVNIRDIYEKAAAEFGVPLERISEAEY